MYKTNKVDKIKGVYMIKRSQYSTCECQRCL